MNLPSMMKYFHYKSINIQTFIKDPSQNVIKRKKSTKSIDLPNRPISNYHPTNLYDLSSI